MAAAKDGSERDGDGLDVEVVVEFLSKRNVLQSTLETLKNEKMDCVAVTQTPESVLRNLGLATGDIYSLKAFCQTLLGKSSSDEREERKRKLIEELQQGRGKQKVNNQKSKALASKVNIQVEHKQKEKPRRVSLGWLNYSTEEKRYKSVRQMNGGGSRDVFLSGDSTKVEVIEFAKNLFFPGGNSKQGKAVDFCFDLANFQGNVILSIVEDSTGKELPFTINNYVTASQLSRVRLYLSSRPCLVVEFEIEDDEDADLLQPVLWKNPINPKKDTKDEEEKLQERRNLIDEQDKAYHESLEADRKKDVAKVSMLDKELAEANRLEAIRQARELRLPAEPDKDCPRVQVTVLHVTKGRISRFFKKEELMHAVYDWVGSLGTYPEQFAICEVPGVPISPKMLVESHNGALLFMDAAEEPVLIDESDKEVSFKGFGSSDSDCNDTLPYESNQHTVRFPEEILPRQIMENDSSGEENQDDDTEREPGRRFRAMVNRLYYEETHSEEEDEESGQEVRCIVVRRQNVLHDVLHLYEDRSIAHCLLNVKFEGEVGLDFGGVTTDLFTSFWDAALDKFFEGDAVRVPFVPTQCLVKSKGVFDKLGRILYHGWRLTKEIPSRLCEASFICMLHGEEEVDEDTLERSFMLYLSQYERDLLTNALAGTTLASYQSDALFGIYQQYSMSCLPATSKEELREHIVSMARHEFLFKPMSALLWMKNGIGDKDFLSMRSSLPVEQIKNMYEKLIPSCEKVLSKITHDSEDLKSEQSRMFHFLRKYVGNMDDNLLDRFLRFVTGSSASPQKPIQLAFNTTIGVRRFPSSSTCSSTLFLSTTYQSFSEFKKEFDAVLMQDESYEMGLL